MANGNPFSGFTWLSLEKVSGSPLNMVSHVFSDIPDSITIATPLKISQEAPISLPSLGQSTIHNSVLH